MLDNPIFIKIQEFFLNQRILFIPLSKGNKTLGDIDVFIPEVNMNLFQKLREYFDNSNDFSLVNPRITLSNGFNFSIYSEVTKEIIRFDLYNQLILSTYKTYPYCFKIDVTVIDQENFKIFNNINVSKCELIEIYRATRSHLKSLNINGKNIFQCRGIDLNPEHITLSRLPNNFITSPAEYLRKKNSYIPIDLRKKIFYKLKNLYHFGIAPHYAFIGPDGCGKSTVIESLQKSLLYIHGNTHYSHLRPTIVPARKMILDSISKKESRIPKPHDYKPYNKLIGRLKFLFISVDYILGYTFFLQKRIIGIPIISDRYFYDLLVDPKRFRLEELSWIEKLIIKKCFPRPNKTFLLMADPKVIFKRKKDLTLPEIERQLSTYHEIASSYKEIEIIDSNQDKENVQKDVYSQLFNQ